MSIWSYWASKTKLKKLNEEFLWEKGNFVIFFENVNGKIKFFFWFCYKQKSHQLSKNKRKSRTQNVQKKGDWDGFLELIWGMLCFIQETKNKKQKWLLFFWKIFFKKIRFYQSIRKSWNVSQETKKKVKIKFSQVQNFTGHSENKKKCKNS